MKREVTLTVISSFLMLYNNVSQNVRLLLFVWYLNNKMAVFKIAL